MKKYVRPFVLLSFLAPYCLSLPAPLLSLFLLFGALHVSLSLAEPV